MEMDAQLQNINQGINMKVKEEVFENDETHMENENNEKHLWNECSQEMNENLKTEDKIYVSENSDHGNSKLIEIIKVKQKDQNHQEQISDIKDRSYLEDDSNFENIDQTFEKSNFVIKTEIPSGDVEAGCSYHEDSNIVAEDSYVKVDLEPESGDRTNKEIDAKLENSGSFIDSFDPITQNDLHPDLQEQVSSDQPHIGNYDPPDKWVCINYEKGFKTQYALGQRSIRAEDYMIKHSSTARTHQCNICEKEFNAEQTLKEHIMFSHGRHQCGICNKGFVTKEHLRDHMTCHSTEMAYQCKICERGFTSNHRLQVHMTWHDTERLHKCDMCEKGFKTPADLKSHMRCHSTERPHQCDMCEKAFKTMNDLRSHVRHHTTEKPHQCNMCKKAFKSVQLLRHHSLSHSSDKPLQCHVCHKGFKREGNLRAHMVIHSTEKPHHCTVCDIRFKTKANLRRHLQRSQQHVGQAWVFH